MSYFRSHLARGRLHRFFGQSGEKNKLAEKADIKKTTYSTLGRILNFQKWRLAKVILLTGVHSLFFFGFPLVFQSMSRMSNLKVGEPEEKISEENKEELAQKEKNEASLHNMINDKPKFDFISIRAKLFGENKDKSKPLTEEAIRQRYNEFLFSLVFFFGSMGAIGYFKHMRSRKLEDFYAILLKRKLYRELMIKDYSLFLSKDLNATVIVQKINSNVNVFTRGLVDNVNGILRASFLFIGGSGMMLTMLPKLSVLAAGLVLALGISGKAFNSRIFDESKKNIQTSNSLAAFISDQMSNIQQIKMLGLKGRSSKSLDNHLLKYHLSILSVEKLWALNTMVLESSLYLISLRTWWSLLYHFRSILSDFDWTDASRLHMVRAILYVRWNGPSRNHHELM